MSFNWHECLDIAIFLRDNADEIDQITQESAYRSAVNRAYFASFCYARNFAEDKFGFTPKGNAGDHGAVKNEFKRRAFGDIPPILDALRQWRNKCDYQDTVDNISKISQDAIDGAKKIFNRLNYTQPKN